MISEGWATERRAGFNNVDGDYFAQVATAYDRVVGGRRYAYSRTIASSSEFEARRQAPCSPVIDRTQGNRQHECHPSQSGAMLRSIFGEDRGAFPANPRISTRRLRSLDPPEC